MSSSGSYKRSLESLPFGQRWLFADVCCCHFAMRYNQSACVNHSSQSRDSSGSFSGTYTKTGAWPVPEMFWKVAMFHQSGVMETSAYHERLVKLPESFDSGYTPTAFNPL